MNTSKAGKFRHIVFKDGATWYAVALEFNIVESSSDPKLAFFNLLQAVSGCTVLRLCKRVCHDDSITGSLRTSTHFSKITTFVYIIQMEVTIFIWVVGYIWCAFHFMEKIV